MISDDNLPPLTAEERAAMDSVDMTPIFGTPDEQLKYALGRALHYWRKARDSEKRIGLLRKFIQDLPCECHDEYGQPLGCHERKRQMNDATLNGFRMIAEAMNGSTPQNWQWIGQHMSQRMFGISKERAENYAKKYGGKAEEMK